MASMASTASSKRGLRRKSGHAQRALAQAQARARSSVDVHNDEMEQQQDSMDHQEEDNDQLPVNNGTDARRENSDTILPTSGLVEAGPVAEETSSTTRHLFVVSEWKRDTSRPRRVGTTQRKRAKITAMSSDWNGHHPGGLASLGNHFGAGFHSR